MKPIVWRPVARTEARFGSIEFFACDDPPILLVVPKGYIGPTLVRRDLAIARRFADQQRRPWSYVVDPTDAIPNPLNLVFLRSVRKLTNVRSYDVVARRKPMRTIARLLVALGGPDAVFPSIDAALNAAGNVGVMRRDLSPGVAVRDATPDDLPAIAQLFNALIPTTTIAWRDHLADEAEMAAWFAAQQRDANPILVADVGGEVVGFTTWTWFRGGPRFPGYRHTRELTIHVDGRCQGRGVGRTLIDELVERAREAGVRVLVAGVDGENEASIVFHERLGFTIVARMPEVGRKFERWLDLVLLQRTI